MLFLHSLFKILLASLFLYIAWPKVTISTYSFANLFWLSWLILFLLVIGGNLSTLLKITEPPILEKSYRPGEKTHDY